MAYAGDTNYLAGSLVERIQAEAIVAYSISGVTRKLVIQAEAPEGAQYITIPKVNMGTNQLTSADVSARTDSTTEIDATVINTDKATITPAMYVVRVDQYDSVAQQSASNPAVYWGGLIANAMAAKIDSLLNALFDDFSTSVGTSTVGVTTDDLLAALKSLKYYNAPGQPVWVAPAGSIWGQYGIISEVLSTSAVAGVGAQDQALRDAWIGRIAGIDVFHSNEFTENSNATKSGIFVKSALAYGFVPFKVNGNTLEIRVEQDRAPTKLLTSWVGSVFGGVIKIYDRYGVELHVKTS